MRRWRGLCAVTAMGVALAACGNGGDGSPRAATSSQASPAPAATGDRGGKRFPAAANAACDTADTRMWRVADDAPRAPTGWLDYGRRLDRIFHRMQHRLRRLDPPAQLAEDYAEWLRRLRQAANHFRRAYRTIARYPTAALINDHARSTFSRTDEADRDARQWIQEHLDDLFSCYRATPFYVAHRGASAACKGFWFCE